MLFAMTTTSYDARDSLVRECCLVSSAASSVDVDESFERDALAALSLLTMCELQFESFYFRSCNCRRDRGGGDFFFMG